MKVFGYNDLFESSKVRETVAMVVLIVTVIFPTLEFSGFMSPGMLGLKLETLYIIACVGGLIAFFIMNHTRLLANFLCGPLVGAAVVFTTQLYLAKRENILRIEIVVPLLLGGLPVLAIYYCFVRFYYKSDPQKQRV